MLSKKVYAKEITEDIFQKYNWKVLEFGEKEAAWEEEIKIKDL